MADGCQGFASAADSVAHAPGAVVRHVAAGARLEGKQFITTVIFAEEGEPNLLGVITLEDALLAVDPVNNELIPVVAKRY